MQLVVSILLPAALAAFIAALVLPATTTPATTRPASTTTVSTTPVSAVGIDPRRSGADGTAVAGRGKVTGAHPDPTPSATWGSQGDRAATVSFTWPVSPRPVVGRGFEAPRTRWSRGHRGVDLLTAVRHPVLAAGAGVVAFSGVVAGRGVITVRHPGGLRTSYEPVDGRLPAGALVRRGARIGVVSSRPGHCAPLTCLHWGAIFGHTYRDPLSLLGFGRPILLPLH